jgi:carboxypeptidase Taq
MSLAQLEARLGEIADLNAAADLLNWDQRTYMPPGAAEVRAVQLSTLRRTAHEWFISDEIGQLLNDLDREASELEYDSHTASLIRVTRREYELDRRVPLQLVAERAKATSLAQVAWQKARAASDFAYFQPHLEVVLDLTIQLAEARGYEDRIYDALLGQFEPEVRVAQVEILFEELKAGLGPIVQAIAERADRVDDSLLAQRFDEEKQWDFGLQVIEQLGFDLEHGRQDRSAHPFTISFSPSDVRLTTRLSPDQFKMGLFASIHEAGHGMYSQGLDRSLDRTPLGSGASLGIHESQSRLWENIVGRSRGFWTFWLPRLKEVFPQQLEGIGVEAFYRAVNRVEPTLIRVEADEVTYNQHIFVRFEIENLLLEGKVRVSDLPELWNAKMEEYLGIGPPNDALGVLQDVHWASGTFGYFPTYSLGNLLSAQFYTQAISEEPRIPAQIQQGDFEPLFNWMRTKIHAAGRKYTPAEVVERVTGGPMSTAPFLTYVQRKFGEIYEL